MALIAGALFLPSPTVHIGYRVIDATFRDDNPLTVFKGLIYENRSKKPRLFDPILILTFSLLSCDSGKRDKTASLEKF